MASYGREDGELSEAQINRADQVARELGQALVERDIDLVIGGRFDMAISFIEGAAAACKARNLDLYDRLTTYCAEDYPPRKEANVGKFYRFKTATIFGTRS